MKEEILIGSVGTSLSAIGTALQINEILQIISMVITIVGGLITFVVLPLINWYKSAKSDGKITKEEISDGIKIAKDGIDKIKSDADEIVEIVEIENKEKEE